MCQSRVEGWRLLSANDLLKVLNKVAGRVSDRVFVSRKCNFELGKVGVLYQGKRGDTSVR